MNACRRSAPGARCSEVRFLFAIAAAALLATGAHARDYTAEVSHVTDGDTLWVRSTRGAPRPLRIQAIDAPEICQPFGREAQAALAARVLHRRVLVSARGKDDYRRTLARVRHDGEDVGAWLVAEGYAWAHRWHRRVGAYAQLEARARAEHRGLWAYAAPMEPREFRKRHGSCRP